MKLPFGIEIVRRQKAQQLSPVFAGRGGGWVQIFEPFIGAWQKNIKIDRDTVLSNPANFACKTLIASDIAKNRVKLVEKDSNSIWSETTSPAFSPVIRKPNDYQTRIQFWESWFLSKLSFGNTYVLKQRDSRNIVVALYVLDPRLVTPKVSDSGDVYYDLNIDNLSGIMESILVPASEIIHDRYNCLFHPLVGLSPIFANGVAATQAINIQNNQVRFFGNRSMPSGILTAPAAIGEDTAKRLKEDFHSNYSGVNVGKVAVLGDGLKFESMAQNAVDSQLIEQLKWSSEIVAATYHVPAYKIGAGPLPTVNNLQSLNVEYYTQALQRLIEDAELCLDEGLGIGDGVTVNGTTYGVEFDLDNLLRMDASTLMDVLDKSAGKLTIDEMRARAGYKPTPGGNAVYLQQQNFSLEALAKRDAKQDPFGSATAQKPAVPEQQPVEANISPDRVKAVFKRAA